jgi:hypothetical protein
VKLSLLHHMQSHMASVVPRHGDETHPMQQSRYDKN